MLLKLALFWLAEQVFFQMFQDLTYQGTVFIHVISKDKDVIKVDGNFV